MKKRIGLKTLALILSCLTVVGVVGCDNGNGKKDPSKINAIELKVTNYNGGVRTQWLYNIEKDFEALFDGVKFSGNKEGVDLVITAPKTSIEQDLSSDAHIIINENLKTLELTNNKVAVDITDVLTMENPYDNNKTIESKLTSDQIDLLKAKNNAYYFIPHYQTIGGVFYDVNLFNGKKFYISKTGGWTNVDAEKSAGPDGDITTAFDNGLPATY